MIKAIIFDADGVIINAQRFSKQLERDYGIPAKHVGSFFEGKFQDCLVGKADLKEELAKEISLWGWKGSVDELVDYWFRAEHKLDEALIKYVKILRTRGIHCYLATNQEKYRVSYMLDHMGFKDVFDKVYASAHLGERKPSIEFFSKILQDLGGISKTEILFWDDTPENIDSAKKIGINAELYSTFENFRSKMKDLLTHK